MSDTSQDSSSESVSVHTSYHSVESDFYAPTGSVGSSFHSPESDFYWPSPPHFESVSVHTSYHSVESNFYAPTGYVGSSFHSPESDFYWPSPSHFKPGPTTSTTRTTQNIAPSPLAEQQAAAPSTSISDAASTSISDAASTTEITSRATSGIEIREEVQEPVAASTSASTSDSGADLLAEQGAPPLASTTETILATTPSPNGIEETHEYEQPGATTSASRTTPNIAPSPLADGEIMAFEIAQENVHPVDEEALAHLDFQQQDATPITSISDAAEASTSDSGETILAEQGAPAPASTTETILATGNEETHEDEQESETLSIRSSQVSENEEIEEVVPHMRRTSPNEIEEEQDGQQRPVVDQVPDPAPDTTRIQVACARRNKIWIKYFLVQFLTSLIGGLDLGAIGLVVNATNFMNNKNHKQREAQEHAYSTDFCKYFSMLLRIYMSVTYIVSLALEFVSLPASLECRRKTLLMFGSASLVAGVVLSFFVSTQEVFVIGRIMIGVGYHFCQKIGNMAIDEFPWGKKQKLVSTLISPVMYNVGILFVNVLGSKLIGKSRDDWKYLLMLPLVPGVLLVVLSTIISETPVGYLLSGKPTKAREVCRKVLQGLENDEQLEQLAAEYRPRGGLWAQIRIIRARSLRPSVFISALRTSYEQLAGTAAITFFSPLVFASVGLTSTPDDAYTPTYFTVGASIIGIVLAAVLAPRCRRRIWLLLGISGSAVSQAIFAYYFYRLAHHEPIQFKNGLPVFILTTIYSVLYKVVTTSPMNWIENAFSPENAIIGNSISASVTNSITIVFAIFSPVFICWLDYKFFIIIAVLLFHYLVAVFIFVPETSKVTSHPMLNEVLRRHWLWRHFVD